MNYQKAMGYWVYVLRCKGDRLYTGYTSNLQQRYVLHLAGQGAKYTRSFKPIEMVQAWCTGESKSVAMQVEAYIKKLSREQKIRLIQQPDALVDLFELKAGACGVDLTRF